MSKLGIKLSVALIIGLATSPATLTAAPETSRFDAADGLQRQAFSLDDMNCFSSDIQARAVVPETASGEPDGTRLADESGGGTNGIPCNRRDPKAPPARRSQG